MSYTPLNNPTRNRVFAQLRSWIRVGAPPSVDEGPGDIVINFPVMPDTIELARRVNYTNMAANSPATPDGFHVYRSTEPLKIPIKFTAHSYDVEYTRDDGPVALLQIAARLHALTLPIMTSTSKRGDFTVQQLQTEPTAPDKPAGPGSQPVDGAAVAKTVAASNFFTQNVTAVNPNDMQIYFPVPCILNILLAEWRGKVEYGIYCSGFVEDVSVTLHGPWLQGRANSGHLDGLRNMPSYVDYAFTFVHQPGYTNNFLGGALGGANTGQASTSMVLQAMAQDVYQRLFNQIQMDKLSTRVGGVQDFSVRNIFDQ